MEKLKKTARGLLVLALLSALLCTAAMAATSAITTVSGYEALRGAAGGVALPDVPQGATDAQYSLLSGEPAVAQIRFTYNGMTCHLRACACADASNDADISGMKAIFGKDGLQAVSGTDGQAYQMGVKGTNGLITWYSEAKKCKYSLLAQPIADGESLQALASTVRASAENVESAPEKGASVDGAVKSVNKKHITVTAPDGLEYTFSIDGSTANPDQKKLKKKATVRVSYEAPYMKNCAALSITLIEDADKTGGGGGGKGGGGKGGGKTTPTASKTPKPTTTPNPKKQYKDSGVVSMEAGNLFEMRTAKGATLTFLIEDAEVVHGDEAEIGSKASVVYNYVKDSIHLIKVTFSKVKPTPTPAPPTKTMAGVIDSIDTQSLSLVTTSGMSTVEFDIATAKIKGDLDADEGDNAKVTYFEDEDGRLIATVVVLSKDEPDPTEEPDPTDEPDIDIPDDSPEDSELE